jgi:uncharacterized membrane protein
MASAEADGGADLPRLTRLVRAVGLLALEAVSLGLAVWSVSSRDEIPAYVIHNQLAPDARIRLGIILLGSLAVTTIAALLWIGLRRTRGLDDIELLSRKAAPLSTTGLLPFLFDWRLWAGRDVVFLVLVAIFGFGTRAAVRFAYDPKPQVGRNARLSDMWPTVTVVSGAIAYAAYFSMITVTNHRNLGTASFDLGLEDNLMWNLTFGGRLFRSTPFSGPAGASHFGHHATLFSFVLAPVYRLIPGPETLLVIQCLVVGAAAIPFYLYARRHLAPWQAATISFAYLLYPPLHGANLYDFHYLTLGIFFLWLLLWAIETDRRLLGISAALLTISLREDVAACAAVLGAFLVLSGSRPRAGLWLMCVGAGYFAVMKILVMPLFEGGQQSFVGQYSGLLPSGRSDYGALLETALANPPFTAGVVLQWDKIVYFLQIMVPVLFLPLRRPMGLLFCLPGFFFTLLSTGYWPLYSILFQYTSYWTAFVFIGVVFSLQRVPVETREVEHVAWLAGVLCASLATSYLYGTVLQHNTLRGGFHAETTAADLRNRSDLRDLIREIPREAKVVASETLVPHVSTRANAYTLRLGLYDADYLLFQAPPIPAERKAIVEALSTNAFGVIAERGEMILAKRGHATEKNAEVVESLSAQMHADSTTP